MTGDVTDRIDLNLGTHSGAQSNLEQHFRRNFSHLYEHYQSDFTRRGRDSWSRIDRFYSNLPTSNGIEVSAAVFANEYYHEHSPSDHFPVTLQVCPSAPPSSSSRSFPKWVFRTSEYKFYLSSVFRPPDDCPWKNIQAAKAAIREAANYALIHSRSSTPSKDELLYWTNKAVQAVLNRNSFDFSSFLDRCPFLRTK